jgi:hypothetical protein
VAYSDVHGAPAQRFYNLVCLAYGADPVLFVDAVEKGYLPEGRASSCKREYNQVAFAFRELIGPHLDQQLAKQVLNKQWLPSENAPRSPNCHAGCDTAASSYSSVDGRSHGVMLCME